MSSSVGRSTSRPCSSTPRRRPIGELVEVVLRRRADQPHRTVVDARAWRSRPDATVVTVGSVEAERDDRGAAARRR